MPEIARWLAKHPIVLSCWGVFMLGIATAFAIRGIIIPLTIIGVIAGLACLFFARHPNILEKIHREE